MEHHPGEALGIPSRFAAVAHGMIARRLWAITALVCAAAAVVLAVVVAVDHFPKGLTVLASLVLAACAAAYAVVRRGARRAAGIAAAGLLVAGGIALVVVENR